MIEFNKPYLYKGKTVFPAVINGTNIICFDSKGNSIFVKKESDLTKVEEKDKIVEPVYIKSEENIDTKKREDILTEKPVENIVGPEPLPLKEEEQKIEVVESIKKDEEYDDFYEIKVPKVAKNKKKRVNVIEKNDYI